MTNPKSVGSNCNTTPFLLTSEDNLEPKNYPKYMVQKDNRVELFPERFSPKSVFTFDEWRRLASILVLSVRIAGCLSY